MKFLGGFGGEGLLAYLLEEVIHISEHNTYLSFTVFSKLMRRVIFLANHLEIQ